MQRLGHRRHCPSPIGDAAVLPVAMAAAKYGRTDQERALQVLRGRGDLAGRLSAARFNRRLHALGSWRRLLATRGELFATGAAFLLDSMPVPAGRRARARRGKKRRGQAC